MPYQRDHHQPCSSADCMTRVPTLFPGESILTAGVDVTTDRIEVEVKDWGSAGDAVVLHDGGPWLGGDHSIDAFHLHVHRQIAEAFGIKPIHQGRKTCLSCGAIQTLAGDLPCGH